MRQFCQRTSWMLSVYTCCCFSPNSLADVAPTSTMAAWLMPATVISRSPVARTSGSPLVRSTN